MSPNSPAASLIRGRSTRTVHTGTSAVPAGFGPILRQEYALQIAVEHHRSRASGPHGRDLVQVLDNQQTQLSVGIAALDRRCGELPHGERFDRPEWRQATVEAAPTARVEDGLEGLAALHLELASRIRQVMEHHLTRDGEPALESVARGHEEMAWVLSALSHDGEFTEGAYASEPAPSADPTAGQSRWENEGGAVHTVADPSSAQGPALPG